MHYKWWSQGDRSKNWGKVCESRRRWSFVVEWRSVRVATAAASDDDKWVIELCVAAEWLEEEEESFLRIPNWIRSTSICRVCVAPVDKIYIKLFLVLLSREWIRRWWMWVSEWLEMELNYHPNGGRSNEAAAAAAANGVAEAAVVAAKVL